MKRKAKIHPRENHIAVPLCHGFWIRSVISKRREMMQRFFPARIPQDSAAWCVLGIYIGMGKDYT